MITDASAPGTMSRAELVSEAYRLAHHQYGLRHSHRAFKLLREATKYALIENTRHDAEIAMAAE